MNIFIFAQANIFLLLVRREKQFFKYYCLSSRCMYKQFIQISTYLVYVNISHPYIISFVNEHIYHSYSEVYWMNRFRYKNEETGLATQFNNENYN